MKDKKIELCKNLKQRGFKLKKEVQREKRGVKS